MEKDEHGIATVTRQASFLEETAGARRLSDVAVLGVSGEDAREWLEGQVTNEVKDTEAGDAVYSLVVSQKGRVLSDLWLLDVGEEGFLLLVPTEAAEALRERFESHIIMEDVEVDLRQDLSVLTVQGPRSTEALGAVEGALEASYSCGRLGPEGRDLVVRDANVDATLGELGRALDAIGGGVVSEAGWELARARLGVAAFGKDFDAAAYPQEAGLERRAVSFTKGCYVGQEVVFMLEQRGRPSRRLVRLELAAASGAVPIEPGDEVHFEGKVVGRVTSAVLDPERQTLLAMAYVKAALAEPGQQLDVREFRMTLRRVLGAPTD